MKNKKSKKWTFFIEFFIVTDYAGKMWKLENSTTLRMRKTNVRNITLTLTDDFGFIKLRNILKF